MDTTRTTNPPAAKYRIEELAAKLREITDPKTTAGKLPVVGLLLYTRRHAAVAELLRNPTIWQSIDEQIKEDFDDRLDVFYIHPDDVFSAPPPAGNRPGGSRKGLRVLDAPPDSARELYHAVGLSDDDGRRCWLIIVGRDKAGSFIMERWPLGLDVEKAADVTDKLRSWLQHYSNRAMVIKGESVTPEALVSEAGMAGVQLATEDDARRLLKSLTQMVKWFTPVFLLGRMVVRSLHVTAEDAMRD